MTIERVCQNCGIIFPSTQFRINSGGGKYHNRECYGRSRQGTKVSEQTKEKMRIKATGRGHSDETRKKISLIKTGKPNPKMKGENNPLWRGGKIETICKGCGIKFFIKRSEINNNGNFHNRDCSDKARKGKKVSDETKRKISLAHTGKPQYNQRGEKSYRWKGGKNSLRERIRKSLEYSQWRTKVFIRDNFICQKCGQLRGKIEAHHKRAFYLLAKEAKQYMPLFDLYTACLIYAPIWDVNNGITLCESCHKKTKNYGMKGKSRSKI